MENPIPPHFTESQHALHIGLRICGIYLRPVDFELMWEVQKAFHEKGDLTLMNISKIETEVRSKYNGEGTEKVDPAENTQS